MFAPKSLIRCFLPYHFMVLVLRLSSINKQKLVTRKVHCFFSPFTINEAAHTRSQKLLLSKTGQMQFQNSCSLSLIMWQKSIKHLFHWTDDIFQKKIYILSATGSICKSDLTFLCIGFLLSVGRERGNPDCCKGCYEC